MITLKRMAIYLYTFPFLDYEIRIDEIRISEEELKIYRLYKDENDIFINDCHGREFYILLFFEDSILDIFLKEIEVKCKNRLIKYFQAKIQDCENMITLIKDTFNR